MTRMMKAGWRMPDGDMHIEDVSHCDYCHNRYDCYDETMIVDACSSFCKDEKEYNAILKYIAEMNGTESGVGNDVLEEVRMRRVVCCAHRQARQIGRGMMRRRQNAPSGAETTACGGM